jgi:hypothetical protein
MKKTLWLLAKQVSSSNDVGLCPVAIKPAKPQFFGALGMCQNLGKPEQQQIWMFIIDHYCSFIPLWYPKALQSMMTSDSSDC